MTVGGDASGGTKKNVPDEVLKAGDTLLHGQYTIDGYLSAGGFGVTYLARDSLQRVVVIKECFPNSMCCRSEGRVRARSSSQEDEFKAVVRNFGQEALRMSKLEHPNIVGVHQVFEDNNTAYMALDFVEGRDLLEIVEEDREKLPPAEVKRILLTLLDAIRYIHSQDVLHRDIAPDNILLDKTGKPVLIDFGAAREVATRASRALSAKHIVKDGYSPQEFYLSNGVQTASSDLYSLAATFYHLITGVAPPNSQIRLAALAAEELDPYVPISPLTPGYDHFFLGALEKALAVFPKHRTQSAEEWIEEIDREKRQKAMALRARKDKEIELSIRQLTIECNEALLSGDDDEEPDHPAARARAEKKRKKDAAAAARSAGARNNKLKHVSERTNIDAVAQAEGQAPRKGSLFKRIVIEPIWLFAIGRYRGNTKSRGLDQ